MATAKPNVTALVDQMPESDTPRQESKLTGPDPEAAAKIFEEILAGGRESLLELTGMLRDPADPEFRNYKAEYVLHGLAIYVGRPGKEEQRQRFARTVAAELDNAKHSRAVKECLIRALQVAGRQDAVGMLGRCLLADDLCETAAQALIAIQEGAAVEFRQALPKASGKLRVTLIQALGVLRDAKSSAALKLALGDADREVRIAAAWALANLGDSQAASLLLARADAAAGWERIQTTKACLVLAEHLRGVGKRSEAARIYTHLRDTRRESSERYLREAVEGPLATLR